MVHEGRARKCAHRNHRRVFKRGTRTVFSGIVGETCPRLSRVLVCIFTSARMADTRGCSKLWKARSTRNTRGSMSRGPRNNITALHKGNSYAPPFQWLNANGSPRCRSLQRRTFFQHVLHLETPLSPAIYRDAGILWNRTRLRPKIRANVYEYEAYRA